MVKCPSNVYLRRIHNYALGMEWLLKSVIPRLQWPKPVFKAKRAITAEEHAAIVAREVKVRCACPIPTLASRSKRFCVEVLPRQGAATGTKTGAKVVT